MLQAVQHCRRWVSAPGAARLIFHNTSRYKVPCEPKKCSKCIKKCMTFWYMVSLDLNTFNSFYSFILIWHSFVIQNLLLSPISLGVRFLETLLADDLHFLYKISKSPLCIMATVRADQNDKLLPFPKCLHESHSSPCILRRENLCAKKEESMQKLSPILMSS